MDDRVSFRRYRPADWEAVVALDRQAMAAYGLERPIDDPRRADLRDVEGHYHPPGGLFLAGTAGSRIVAMGGFLAGRPGVARLRRLRVDPGFRRRGIARKLVGLLEAKALAAGYAGMMLHVRAHQQAALALYRQLGYEMTCDGPGDRGIDVYLGKALG